MWNPAKVMAAVVTLAVPALPGPATAAKASPLVVQVEKSKVDFKQHRLELKMSRPAGKVKITVYSESDAVIADEEHDFSGRPPLAPLIVTWSPSGDAPVARIELRAYDAQDMWSSVELFSWYVPIQHEDVNFATGSADIAPAEAPKLEEAFKKLEEILAKDRAHGRQHPGLTFYIAGHTDTVGGDASNLKLSHARARSIAGWFRKRGVRIPIAFEGFGETALAVRTADGVDEIRNRRADYILADDPPPVKTTGFRPAWKRIP